ncbi:lytic polysaccharide monooxygenase [Lentithecium fluviatile CBS 122367]|uniref:lytic cellulose monooxygenase (C4-dehydrogenating) n=1 Tax=Lentithecium fluviatile CBS 122367 TaxID=1168545 RepID=A0A6G1JD91_9PLEO|nr:lytic polysaccharide monooxygenase [Lentithecium fluviatile CBS 122367]
MARFSFLLATLVATNPLVQAHFRFVRIARNGVWQAPFRFMRNTTSPYTEPLDPNSDDPNYTRTFFDPSYYTDHPNSVRCGRGNMEHAAETQSMWIKAGDTLEFATAAYTDPAFGDARVWECGDRRGFCTFGLNVSEIDRYGTFPMSIAHSGPVSTYLSAVPSGQEIEQYDGSGEWIKLHTTGVQIWKNMTNVHWLPNNNTGRYAYASGINRIAPRMPFKIPEQTPTGSYLLRIDLLYTTGWYPAQLYPTCAHILVEGAAEGALPKGVKFPEVYDPKMPGEDDPPFASSLPFCCSGVCI